MNPMPRRRATSTKVPMPTSTYPAVKTLSQESVTVSSGSRMRDVVSVATAT
jgi:hypothetical protein